MGILENLENLKKEDLERVVEIFCIEKIEIMRKCFKRLKRYI